MAKTAFPFGAWPPKCLPGWHWPNLSHGHRVYRGPGGLAGVDWSLPVGFAQADATSVVVTAAGHAPSTRYTYAVRPVAGNGWLQTPDVSCLCEFQTGPTGAWAGRRPVPVEWLGAAVLAGGQIRLSWSWRRPAGGAEAAAFSLYCRTGPGIEPGAPDAVADFLAEGTQSYTFQLEGGQSCWFAVAARSADAAESHLSAVIGPFVADAAAPAMPRVFVTTRR
jgi:hypothetical protein